jgi:hypothetical protein
MNEGPDSKTFAFAVAIETSNFYAKRNGGRAAL